jgi:hypothetical protein
VANLTVNFNFPKPDRLADPAENVDEAFDVVAAATDQVDALFKAHADAIAGKAATNHVHTIENVTGLQDALNAKMAANATFDLDWLSNVAGAAAAPDGYVLIKSGGGWIPASAAAAMGAHGHAIGEVTGLSTALSGRLEKADNLGALADKPAALSNLGFSEYVKSLKAAANAAALQAAIGLGGTVLQVKTATKTDTASFSSTTNDFTTFGLAVSISPKRATSKVLVLALLNINANVAGGSFTLVTRLQRGANPIGVGDALGARLQGGAAFRKRDDGAGGHVFGMENVAMIAVDTPGSTDEQTYQAAATTTVTYHSTVYVNRTVADPDQPYGARASSTIVAVEVGVEE